MLGASAAALMTAVGRCRAGSGASTRLARRAKDAPHDLAQRVPSRRGSGIEPRPDQREHDRARGPTTDDSPRLGVESCTEAVIVSPGWAVLWEEGRLIELGTLGGATSSASAINDTA
jgi:hypothetical protein